MTVATGRPRLPVDVVDVAEILAGPQRVGSEQRWRVRLSDGRPAVVAMLLEELAVDPSLRRRYVRDLERLRGLEPVGVARLLATGPSPDPRDPEAEPPWRLREDPPGETLHAWLERRAPAPIDEVTHLVARLADVVQGLHAQGAVLRDLHPRNVLLAADGSIMLTDIGLARVDILSTRTAASLLLEGSPYASPEQLTRTAVDGRSDVYALGVILFRGLTGVLPFGEGPSILRSADDAPPRLGDLRPGVPGTIDAVCGRCLAYRSDLRPDSAGELAAVLQGDATVPERSLARVLCQACGASLRSAQRLCLSCGRVAVQFRHADENTQEVLAIALQKIEESAEQLSRLRDFLSAVSQDPLPPLNFLIGDARMYSKEERDRLIRLPVRLFDGLPRTTATEIEARMKELGLRVKMTPASPRRRNIPKIARVVSAFGVAMLVAAVMAMASAGVNVGGAVVAGLSVAVVVAALVVARVTRRTRAPVGALLRLRAAPAALPASDPLVARLGALLGDGTSADVREHVGEMALLVQRLCDHRLENAGERAEIDAVTQPVETLVDRVEVHVTQLEEIDQALAELDEGTMVRALAASEARGEPPSARDDLLAGLDRLRALEEERAAVFHRLLDATSLMRRSIELGLSVRDPEREHERNVELALRALAPARED